jgi:hypothetical protein
MAGLASRDGGCKKLYAPAKYEQKIKKRGDKEKKTNPSKLFACCHPKPT